MENKKQEGVKLNIILDSVYTLNKNNSDLRDKNNYLYKDGVITMCPHLSGTVTDFHTRQQVLAPYPCGTFCHHFHLKQVVEKAPATAEKKEEIIRTDKVKVGLSCGSSGVFFNISGLTVGEQKPSVPSVNPSETNLKVASPAEK